MIAVAEGYATASTVHIATGHATAVAFNGAEPVRRDTLDNRADVLKRFVRASAEGWKSYLANPAPGNALIRKDNPQMTEELLAYSWRKMREYAIVEGGEARRDGLLSMTDARWKATVDFLKLTRLAKPNVDYSKAWSLGVVRDVRVLP